MDWDNLFGKHQIPPGNVKSFDLGCMMLEIKREKEGWFLKSTVGSNGEDSTPEKTADTGEYFQTGKSNSVVIAPALPEKPLVFKSSRLTILSGEKLTFFLKIPLSIQIYSPKLSDENLLKEIPSKRLSDTWFGEPDEGEAAFALGSEYFLNFDTIETTPLEAVCPVTIFNHSSALFEVQRLMIRVENLSVYLNSGKKTTSMVQLEYKGQEVLGSAEYRYSKSYNGEKQEVIAKPRNISGINLLKMNFQTIKNRYKSEQE